MSRIIILVVINSTSYSQISKGTLQPDGNIGYSKSNLNDSPLLVSDYENRLLSILPNAGKFVTPNTDHSENLGLRAEGRLKGVRGGCEKYT